MLPVPVDWLLIVRSCDEITFPRCSWAHFINLAQPLQMDFELFELSKSAPDISTEASVPYLHGNCWPIRSVEQVSIIYIYSACTVYWNVSGFDRQICPQPCAQSPCSVLPFTRSGSCKTLGIHARDFDCECTEGFTWDRNTFACISENQCERFCHPSQTATCEQDTKSTTVTCVCRLGYMGHDCSQLLDACLVGSEVYNSFEVGSAKPIIPPGREACGTENKCIPRLGTTSFSCQCKGRFTMDRGLPYDNCLSSKDPCSSRICIEGACVASEDGSWSMCDCEEGFAGSMCEEALGEWTTWSAWTSCEPFCGNQRLRRRIRVCSGDREEDCIGAVEQVQSCPDGEPCPLTLSSDEVEWKDFADWFCILLSATVAYMGLLLLLLTILSLCKPVARTEETAQTVGLCQVTLQSRKLQYDGGDRLGTGQQC
ncbi:acidic fibroblast growth factor intracellular [Echinococcus multilocularis]|uniref:Acidic fibroblast growth factor intracellular n=1 Tax=Echinococcus multilocularis TaxID=6211 RepID=A0A068XY12_ECHMU|nr:acidic fibroblast growth factor intracellular [Echinococcus multilocularis]